MPLRPFRFLAVFAGPLLFGGKSERGYSFPARRVPHLRIRAKIPHKDHFVDACHAMTSFISVGSGPQSPSLCQRVSARELTWNNESLCVLISTDLSEGSRLLENSRLTERL